MRIQRTTKRTQIGVGPTPRRVQVAAAKNTERSQIRKLRVVAAHRIYDDSQPSAHRKTIKRGGLKNPNEPKLGITQQLSREILWIHYQSGQCTLM
jgi:hypothetical protein